VHGAGELNALRDGYASDMLACGGRDGSIRSA
jgi:hypothetical protein